MNRKRLLSAAAAASIAASVGLLGPAAGSAHAASTTYYVSPSGSDSNTGTSPHAPLRTIQKAADRTRPGDTVALMNGTYTESARGRDVVDITRSGRPGAPITYRAHRGHKPVIRPVTGWHGIRVTGASYIRITGLEIKGNTRKLRLADARRHATPGKPRFNTNCLGVYRNERTGAQAHHVRIARNRVHDCPGGGISAIDADHVTIHRNRVYSTSWYTVYATSGISVLRALDVDRGNPRKYKIRITGNVVYDNETKVKWTACRCYSDGNGIIVDTLKDKKGKGADYRGRVLVANNLAVNNGGSGIHSYKSQHVDLINNTAYRNARSRRMTGYANIYAIHSTDVRILNNISYSRRGRPSNLSSHNSRVTYDYNLYYGGQRPVVTGPHDRLANPRFAKRGKNPATADFRTRKGSPAVDSGTAFRAVKRDLAGRKRPAGKGIDRGAYERGASSPDRARGGTRPQGGAGPLAETGADLTLVGGGVTALACGAAILVLVRRKRAV